MYDAALRDSGLLRQYTGMFVAFFLVSFLLLPLHFGAGETLAVPGSLQGWRRCQER
jgi:hypothetical protein